MAEAPREPFVSSSDSRRWFTASGRHWATRIFIWDAWGRSVYRVCAEPCRVPGFCWGKCRHKLAHVSVVKKIAKIGEIKNGEKFSSAFQLDHALGVDAKNGRVIVFVQEPHQGRVIGVALTHL